MDTNKLRDLEGRLNLCYNILPEYGQAFIQAADRIDELESRLKEYDGAPVVEVDSPIVCVFYRGLSFDCQLTKEGCPMRDKDFNAVFPSNCPIRGDGVIVKMKKEN